jgi:hypothetical protein
MRRQKAAMLFIAIYAVETGATGLIDIQGRQQTNAQVSFDNENIAKFIAAANTKTFGSQSLRSWHDGSVPFYIHKTVA